MEYTARYYEKYIKRLLDVILSGIALIVLSPFLLITALCIKISMGGPVIFVQKRIGKGEIPFNLLKFRSMKNAFDEYGVAFPDEQRITKAGKIIRKTSLDELPSLINIFRGDMSFVGPRPLPVNYGPWFSEEERARHCVKGGLTGLAQVNGRNSIMWEERFKYDLVYVKKISFVTDIKIILKTVKVVLKKNDIGERGISTPPDFHVYRSGLTEQELAMLDKEKK